MTGPDYNALQLERNAYNRKVDPYKLPQIGTEFTRLRGTLKCNNQGLNQKPQGSCDPHVRTTNL